MRLIDADALFREMEKSQWYNNADRDEIAEELVLNAPTIEPEPQILRCKDCKHQEKFFHEDKRRKNGGYYIFGCELADGYSHVCLDDDYCSRAERKDT